MVDLSFDQSSVNKQGHQKPNSHKQHNKQHCSPHALSLVKNVRTVFVLNEGIALFRLIYEGLTDHFENIRRLEQAIEVLTIYDCLWVENNVLLISLTCQPEECILRVEFF